MFGVWFLDFFAAIGIGAIPAIIIGAHVPGWIEKIQENILARG